MSLQSRLPVNPLLLPPRLLLRALEDLHTIALAAARLEEVEERLDARLAAVLELGERVEQLGELVDERIGQIDARAAEVVALGERVDGRAEAIVAMGERVDGRLERLVGVGDRVDEILEQGRRIEEVANEVANRGGQIAEALPILGRAVEMAVPLEGAVERLGRIVDRLPQVPQRRARASGAKKSPTASS